MRSVVEAPVKDFVVSQKSEEVVLQRFLVRSQASADVVEKKLVLPCHACAEVVDQKAPRFFVPSQVSTRALVKYRFDPSATFVVRRPREEVATWLQVFPAPPIKSWF